MENQTLSPSATASHFKFLNSRRIKITAGILAVLILAVGAYFFEQKKEAEIDPLTKILNASINQNHLKGDFLSGEVAKYDGSGSAEITNCMQNLTGSVVAGKVFAEYNSHFILNQTLESIREELRPIFGYAITQNPPQLNWQWDSSTQTYIFTTHSGDEKNGFVILNKQASLKTFSVA